MRRNIADHCASMTATLAGGRTQQLSEQFQRGLGRQQFHAPRLDLIRPAGFGRHPRIRPRSPVDAQGRQTLTAPPSGQRVQQRVAGGVVGLARRTEDTGHGREHDEEVQRQRPASRRAGSRHLGPWEPSAGRVAPGSCRTARRRPARPRHGSRPAAAGNRRGICPNASEQRLLIRHIAAEHGHAASLVPAIRPAWPRPEATAAGGRATPDGSRPAR